MIDNYDDVAAATAACIATLAALLDAASYRRLQRGLAKWLATQPDCLTDMPGGAKRRNQATTRFRLGATTRRAVGQTVTGLGQLTSIHAALAGRELCAQDKIIFDEAGSILAKLHRMEFPALAEQVAAFHKRRGVLETTKRLRHVHWPEQTIAVDGAEFRSVVSMIALIKLGRMLKLCVAQHGFQEQYHFNLASGAYEFWAFLVDGQPRGLLAVSMTPWALLSLDEAAGPGNASLLTQRETIRAFVMTRGFSSAGEALPQLGLHGPFLRDEGEAVARGTIQGEPYAIHHSQGVLRMVTNDARRPTCSYLDLEAHPPGPVCSEAGWQALLEAVMAGRLPADLAAAVQARLQTTLA